MRQVRINKSVLKEIECLDHRERQWVKEIIVVLGDESISIESLKQMFKPLGGELTGYRKVKNRSLGLRIIFKIHSEGFVEVMVDHPRVTDKVKELIDILIVGKRDKVYQKALNRLKSK